MNTTHRPELNYDGIGINGPDEYRTRVASFDKQADADKYGPLFAAAPEMYKTLECAMYTMIAIAKHHQPGNRKNMLLTQIKAAHDTLNKAKGSPA